MTKLISKITRNHTDLFEIAKEFNIQVFELDLQGTYGAYKYIKRNKVIILNENLDENKKMIVLAHELGHAFLHTKSTCFYDPHNNSKRENEANKFAIELLRAIDTTVEFSIDSKMDKNFYNSIYN